MFPYLDKNGFTRRTRMPAAEINFVEEDSPGFIEMAIAEQSSYINGRLRKRYGNAGGVIGNSLPFGQVMGPVLAAGTSPPAVTLSGRPTLGSIRIRIEVTTGGLLGAAVVRYSTDNGFTWTTGVTTGAAVSLGYGITASFAAGTYSTDNVYVVDSPVPEIVLRWLTILVTQDCYDKRGANPQDPALVRLTEAITRTYDEIKEAADGKEGLFDLPSTEDTDSAVTTGGPMGYSESSPYTWTIVEAIDGYAEDANSWRR